MALFINAQITHAGLVCKLESVEERVMSDVWDMVTYAYVMEFNDEGDITFARTWAGERHSENLPNGTTRYFPEVDASDELLRLFDLWTEEQRKLSADRQRLADELRDTTTQLEEVMALRKGRRAKVVSGRKVVPGVEGVIIWTGPDKFNPSKLRVGLKDDAGTVHWTSTANLEAVPKADPAPLMARIATLKAALGYT